MKKMLLLSLVLLLTIIACARGDVATPEPPAVVTPAPLDDDAPVSSDDPLAPASSADLAVTGPVDATEIEANLLMMESYPVQYMLTFSGTRPTPCHEVLTTVNEPNERNEIHIEAVFATDPDTMCIQVIDEYSVSINLGSFPVDETFTVWVNGVEVAEFTA